jgi:hypothetical protein
MASTDAEMYDSNSSDALSDALGTETLDARSMVPDDHRAAPDTQSNQSWVWISGRQFLKVDHAANIRMGTPISKIWQHGTDHRLAEGY